MSDERVAVVGLGVIGGSFALALAAQGASVRGWSNSLGDREAARRAGLEAGELGESWAAVTRDADAVLLAVPIGALRDVAHATLASCTSESLVMHAGGLQRAAALGMDEATGRRVVGTHPLAGSHESGFGAARATLFAGATVSVDAGANAEQRARIESLWRRAGATRIDYRDAETHDRLMSWVSHLPQLTATALAATLAASEISLDDVGPGARDTTRLAGSPWEQWEALLAAAPETLTDALASLEDRIAELRVSIAERRVAGAARLWERARAWRQGDPKVNP